MNRANDDAVDPGHAPVGHAPSSASLTVDDPAAGRGGKEPREYLAILRRHKLQIVAVAAVLALVTGAVAIGLPPVYRSSATIFVQEQEIPPELVRSTITSFADERIQVISQQVMTRARLEELIEKHDLYPDLRARTTSDKVIERMRRDIALTPIDSSISDRTSGRRVNATIAFEISYDSHDPERAKKVVDELVTLYLNENVQARQQSVAETAAFLSQESQRAAERIREIEANLAEFKRRNAGRTPDSSAINLQLAERTDGDLNRVEREISLLHDRRATLEAQLALVSPNLPAPALPGGAAEKTDTIADRLRTLQTQYATASAIYGADHPDVRRLQREVAALRAEVGDPVTDEDVAGKLEALESQYATLKERYADDHPDVQRLRRSIAALRATGTVTMAFKAKPQPVPEPVRKPDNPAYVALTSQIESTRRELVQLESLREDLRAKQRTYDARLAQIPELERQFRELTRDYDNAQTRYREIRAKEMQAQVAQALEKDQKAERFSVGEPANLPQSPISPKRMRIALLGLIGSLGGGIGLAWLRDILDPSVKGPLELARIAPVPILTAIPYIQTPRERRASVRRAWLVALAGLALAVVLVLAVHQHYGTIRSMLEAVFRRIAF